MKEIDLTEYKKIILNNLILVDKICRENNINYMIFYGTLLGAVRHKGFIPWDDDIDIVMTRKDYYKLGRYIVNHPELGLNFIDISNRDDCYFYCAKVCDSSTMVKESRFKYIDGYGAYIDIFPLDYLPDNKILRKLYMKKALLCERIVQHSSEETAGKSDKLVLSILKQMAHFFSSFFDAPKLVKRMHKEYIRYDKNKTSYIGVPWLKGDFKTVLLKKKTELEFEGYKFYAPYYYDELLTEFYGDYMSLPPEKDRICKHNLLCYRLE